MTADSLARLSTEAIKESKHWPTKWCAEMTDESDEELPHFRCWSADGRDGGTEEMSLGSEDYDDELATYIATMNTREPLLAAGVQRLLNELDVSEQRRDAMELLHPWEQFCRDENLIPGTTPQVILHELADTIHERHIALTANADLTRQLAEARRIGDAALDHELRLHNEQLRKFSEERLDLTRQLAEANRELERWRHGVTIEGDFVCLDSLALSEARAELRAVGKAKP